MPWRACYLSKVPYCSSWSTGKIWVFFETYITLQKTNWFLIPSLLPPLFLLQHYSCVISALGGFQEQTGYSPEQPGLASELLLLWEQVGALVRSLLTSIIPWSFLAASFCLLSAVFQDFLYRLGTFIKRFVVENSGAQSFLLLWKIQYIAGKSVLLADLHIIQFWLKCWFCQISWKFHKIEGKNPPKLFIFFHSST